MSEAYRKALRAHILNTTPGAPLPAHGVRAMHVGLACACALVAAILWRVIAG